MECIRLLIWTALHYDYGSFKTTPDLNLLERKKVWLVTYPLQSPYFYLNLIEKPRHKGIDFNFRYIYITQCLPKLPCQHSSMTRTNHDITQLIPNNPKHYKKRQNIIKTKKNPNPLSQIGISRVCPEIELDLKINTLLNL